MVCGKEVPAGTRYDHGYGYCRFPIQSGLTISIDAAMLAYDSYVKHYGTGQTFLRMAERGGFGLLEFVDLYYGGNGAGERNNRTHRISDALAKSDIRSVLTSL